MAIQEEITLLQFQNRYNSGEICREHMFQVRRADGFVSPHCGHTEYSSHYARHLYQCKECGYQASVAAGTVTRGTHVSLQKWFWAIFPVSHGKRGVSAVRLQEELGVSYPAAWLMLHKIRKAMGDRDAKYRLAGLAELDGAYFGGPTGGGKRGRGTEKTRVLAAVSIKIPAPRGGVLKISPSNLRVCGRTNPRTPSLNRPRGAGY